MLIRTRLRLLFSGLLLLFFSVGILSLNVIQDLDKTVAEGSAGRDRLISAGKIRDLLLSASAEIEDLANWQPADRTRFFGRLDICKETIRRMITDLDEESKTVRTSIESLSKPVTDFDRAVKRALRYLDEEGTDSRNLDLPRKWLKNRLIPDMTVALQALETQLQNQMKELEIESNLSYARLKLIFQGTAFALIIFGLGFYFLVRHWIVTPLELLSSATREISGGRYGEIIPITSQDELGLLARDVESMSAEISKTQAQLVDRERLAAVGEMTATIAHNVRNPLGSIRALAQTRLRSEKGSDSDQSLMQILETVDRADRWLKDLLKGLKPIKLSYGEAELEARIPSICEAVKGYADKRQVSVEFTITGPIPKVKIDERKIEQTILVLLNNAIESCDPGGVVRLSGRSEGEVIIIEVSDDGHGMSEETLSNLFKPYFTTKKSGLGLGLSLSQRIVAGHGGQIEVESELGIGSQFKLTIPLRSTEAREGEEGAGDGTDPHSG